MITVTINHSMIVIMMMMITISIIRMMSVIVIITIIITRPPRGARARERASARPVGFAGPRTVRLRAAREARVRLCFRGS